MGLGMDVGREPGPTRRWVIAACLAGLALGALAGCGSDQPEPPHTSLGGGDDGDDREEKHLDSAGGLVVFIVDRWTSKGVPGGIRLEDVRGGTVVVPPEEAFETFELELEEAPEVPTQIDEEFRHADTPLEVDAPVEAEIEVDAEFEAEADVEAVEPVKPQKFPPVQGGRRPGAGASPVRMSPMVITLRLSPAGRDAPPVVELQHGASSSKLGTLRQLGGQLAEIGRDKAVCERVLVIVEAVRQLPCVWVARSTRLAENAGFKRVRLGVSRGNARAFVPRPELGTPVAPADESDLGGQLIIAVRGSADPHEGRQRRDVLSLITVSGRRKTDLRGVEHCLRLEKQLQMKHPRRSRPPALLLADKGANWYTIQTIIEKAAQAKLAPVWLRAAERPK